MSEAGDTVTVLEASTGNVLSTHRASSKPSPSKTAPVEVMFAPNESTGGAHYEHARGDIVVGDLGYEDQERFRFSRWTTSAPRQQGMPLEMLYNAKGDRLYVTTAKPGFVNLYDNTDPRHPKFLQAIPAAPGAHHSVLSPDERYLFVQNSLLNLEGMSDGSITVIDLTKGTVLRGIDTLKAQGFNPNCIMLLPNHFKQPDLRASQVLK